MSKNEKAYRTLGLDPGASLEAIAAAYERMKVAWNPDRFVGNVPLEKRAAEKLKEIERAYLSLLEAHGIEVSDGPPPSLFDDALAERLAEPRRRFFWQKWVALGAVAVALLLALILRSGSELRPEEDSATSAPPEVETIDSETGEATLDQDPGTVEITIPPGKGSEPSAGSPLTRGATPTAGLPVKAAFEVLQVKAPAAQRLVTGGYPELRYRGWKALRADPPEVTIALLAQSQGEDEPVAYLWVINMETDAVRPLNKPAMDLDAPRPPETRPKLVREE